MLLYYDVDDCLIIVDGNEVYNVTPSGEGVKIMRMPAVESNDFIEGYLSGRGAEAIKFDDDGWPK